MKIRKVKHKGLRRFMESDDSSRLPPEHIERIRNIISYLQEMSDIDELKAIPTWRAHQLTGRRKGSWSLTVSRNWRLTFVFDDKENQIINLDYEDYH